MCGDLTLVLFTCFNIDVSRAECFFYPICSTAHQGAGLPRSAYQLPQVRGGVRQLHADVNAAGEVHQSFSRRASVHVRVRPAHPAADEAGKSTCTCTPTKNGRITQAAGPDLA